MQKTRQTLKEISYLLTLFHLIYSAETHIFFHPGYVTTIFGRRRFLPCINSNNAQLRLQSERQAVNFVIQGICHHRESHPTNVYSIMYTYTSSFLSVIILGSAADICKMGMISIANALERKDLKNKARHVSEQKSLIY